MKRWLLLALAGMCGFVPALAHAHSVLLQATPPDRAVLAQGPAEMRLRFNEPVQAAAVQVLNRDGTNVARASAVMDDVLGIQLAQDLPRGPYIASYRVISADAHPVSGSLVFFVGASEDAQVPQAPRIGEDPWREAVLTLGRAGYLAGLLFALGAALFAIVVDQSARVGAKLRAWITGAALFTVAMAVVGFGLHGVELTGSDFPALEAANTWEVAMQSTRGHAYALSVVCILLIAVASHLARKPRTILIALASFAIASCFVISGHGATAVPRWLTAPAWGAHVVLASFWLGSFVPLLLVTRANAAQAETLVSRFSKAAFIAVPCLLGLGLVMACIMLSAPYALTQTVYGKSLMLKLALIAVLLALAAWNRWRLMPRLAADHPDGGRALRRSFGAELVVGLAVLTVTAFLSRQEPHLVTAHAMAAAPGSFVTKTVSGQFTLDVAVAPASPGANRVAARLLHEGLHLWEPYEVRVEFSKPDAGVEPWTRVMKLGKHSVYFIEGEPLPLAGTWTVRVDALLTEFIKESFTVSIRIR